MIYRVDGGERVEINFCEDNNENTAELNLFLVRMRDAPRMGRLGVAITVRLLLHEPVFIPLLGIKWYMQQSQHNNMVKMNNTYLFTS